MRARVSIRSLCVAWGLALLASVFAAGALAGGSSAGGASADRASVATTKHTRKTHPRSHAKPHCAREHGHCMKKKSKKRTSKKKPSTLHKGTSHPTSTPAPVSPTVSPVAPSSITSPVSGSSTPSSGGGSSPAPATPSAPVGPAHVQVTAREYSFTLSRSEVPAGEVIIQYVNAGQDTHNLHLLSGTEGPQVGAFSETAPGEHPTLKFDMRAGSYMMFCSILNHEELGMKATLTVR